MLRPPTSQLSIKLLDRSIPEPAIRAALAHPNLQILKDGGDRSVFKSLLPDSSPVIIKSRRASGLASSLRRIFRGTSFRRELHGLRTLHRLNIPTNRPLAWAVGQDSNGETIESMILSFIDGPTLLKILSGPKLSIAQELALCRAIGSQLAALSAQDLYNRDNKPSNLIVLDYPVNPRIAVIDAAGIRRVGISTDGLDSMLASLFLEPLGTGINIRRALAMRLIRAYADALDKASPLSEYFTKEYWEMTADFIKSHGDPTPEHTSVH